MKGDIQYLKTSPTNVDSTFYLNKKHYTGHALFHVQLMILLQRELKSMTTVHICRKEDRETENNV
jgi:hypothetical protein